MHRKRGKTESLVTREVAKAFSLMAHFRGDRDVDSPKGRRHRAWITNLLETGQFHDPTWAVAFLNGDGYRIDGAHSSRALADYPGEFPSGLVATILAFDCDTVDDLAYLFQNFDSAYSTRTPAERIGAHKGLHREMDDISPTDCLRIVYGIAALLSEFGAGVRISDSEKHKLVHEYEEYILLAAPFAHKRFLLPVGVMAAIFATWRKAPGEFSKFWTYVADENHPDVKNPTRTLAFWLGDVCFRRNGKARKSPWPSRAYYVKSIQAWNAWRRGNTTTLRYHPPCPLPPLV